MRSARGSERNRIDRRRFVPLLLLVALFLCGRVPARAQVVDAEDGFTARIAQERAAHGLPGLEIAGDLQEVARRQAQRMADQGRKFHNPNLASEVGGDWTLVAENVGFGPTVDDVHQAFMASPAHRDIILHPDLTHVGVGVVQGGDGRLWVAEVFERLEPAPPPAPAPTAPPAPAPTAPPAPLPTTPPVTAPSTAPPPVTQTPATVAPAVVAPPRITAASAAPAPASDDELAAVAQVLDLRETAMASSTADLPDVQKLARDVPGAAWVGAFLLAAVVALQGQTLRRLGLVA